VVVFAVIFGKRIFVKKIISANFIPIDFQQKECYITDTQSAMEKNPEQKNEFEQIKKAVFLAQLFHQGVPVLYRQDGSYQRGIFRRSISSAEFLEDRLCL
jgi:hypothetical protein